jgi:hypothetical protein
MPAKAGKAGDPGQFHLRVRHIYVISLDFHDDEIKHIFDKPMFS